MSASTPSTPPATEDVDSGWDDLPEGAPPPVSRTGKRGPHRQRRAKARPAVTNANPVVLPRPAEPSKKQQREHARKQRAYEAQVKQQRKAERKAQRAAEMRAEAQLRRSQTEAEEQARREARALADAHRAKAAPKTATRKSPQGRQPSAEKVAGVVEAERKEAPAHNGSPRRARRPGVIITLVLLAVAIASLILRK